MWKLARAAANFRQIRRFSSAVSGPCIVHKRGTDILHDPWFNKDTGFPLTERDRLGLRGLLPPRVISFEQQYDRFRMWWTLCGHSLPNLQQLAIKVLSQPCSASACERNWSVFEAVHTKKRNRLEPGKLHDLVYVKLNLHLQVTNKDIQAKDSPPICIENLEGFPGFEVAQVGDDQVVNIGDDEDDELGDSEEEEEDAFENIDFLNPSI